MANRGCPFDGAALSTLSGERSSDVLLGMMISPKSTLYNMVKGSIRSKPDGTVMECPTCGWVAIFTK